MTLYHQSDVMDAFNKSIQTLSLSEQSQIKTAFKNYLTQNHDQTETTVRQKATQTKNDHARTDFLANYPCDYQKVQLYDPIKTIIVHRNGPVLNQLDRLKQKHDLYLNRNFSLYYHLKPEIINNWYRGDRLVTTDKLMQIANQEQILFHQLVDEQPSAYQFTSSIADLKYFQPRLKCLYLNSDWSKAEAASHITCAYKTFKRLLDQPSTHLQLDLLINTARAFNVSVDDFLYPIQK